MAATAFYCGAKVPKRRNFGENSGKISLRNVRFCAAFCMAEPRILRLQRQLRFGILLQRGIAIFDCEAAALPGRFLPELGRPYRAAIFFGLSAPARVFCSMASSRVLTCKRTLRATLLALKQNPSRGRPQ